VGLYGQWFHTWQPTINIRLAPGCFTLFLQMGERCQETTSMGDNKYKMQPAYPVNENSPI